ncbi:hypothetical protein C8Q80DRAFT_1118262 [Daedaleopsis nitida]|nr:hypothetical protein C8Q80DRAFT_1118262 [Daedaleopsis nitida]
MDDGEQEAEKCTHVGGGARAGAAPGRAEERECTFRGSWASRLRRTRNRGQSSVEEDIGGCDAAPPCEQDDDAGRGGRAYGVMVACELNPLTGEETQRLRCRQSALVWYSCLAAGALGEKHVLAAELDAEVEVLLVCAGLCACLPGMAAVTPAWAVERAMPLRVFIPLSTLPPLVWACPGVPASIPSCLEIV